MKNIGDKPDGVHVVGTVTDIAPEEAKFTWRQITVALLNTGISHPSEHQRLRLRISIRLSQKSN
jgi:hypothetical protein